MQEESDRKKQLTVAGTAGRDDIPPSSELSDGSCGNREGGPLGEGSPTCMVVGVVGICWTIHK